MAVRGKGAKGLAKAGRGANKGVFKAGKVAGTVQGVSVNPYVQRLAQDAELRDNLRAAYESARTAYGRLANGKAPAKVIADDKKFQREVQSAASSLRDATDSLREGPKRTRRKRRGGGMVLVLGLVGAGAAVALSEGLRSKILDALFGAEEEFEYTSTTTPSPAPETVTP